MKNTTHRVVVLKNVNSELVEQAILFLKDDRDVGDSRLLFEAEKIVEKYMEKKREISRNKKSRFSPVFLSLCGGIITILILGIVFFA